jgi:NADP-dependent 3-hydroxy acid dehydrogenase YdfG
MVPSRIIGITGASAGIGRAVARRLARDGASLAICARRGDRLGQVAAEIEAAGGQALPFVGDVTSEHDMAELVRLTTERFRRLDVMICNAGFGVAGAIDQMPPEQMRKLLDVNYLGTYYAATSSSFLPLSASAACRIWARTRRRNSRRSVSRRASAPSWPVRKFT